MPPLTSLLPPLPANLADLQLVRHQMPMLRALARTAAVALKQKLAPNKNTLDLPGPELVKTVAPRDPALVERYLEHVGSSSGVWGDALPAHLFPQWGFALLSKTLEPIPYPLADLLNGGARMVVHRPIPANESLTSTAQLVSIDDDGRRAIFHQRLITSTPSAERALEVDFRPIIRLRGAKRSGEKRAQKREKPTVPADARELRRWSLSARSGLEFALLTGDFNPIHWIPLAAKAAGFHHTILHGFASMSRAAEALIAELGGDGQALKVLDVRFVQPLTLPTHAKDTRGTSSAACFVRGQEVYVGSAPGGPAFMTGTFSA